MTITNLVEFQGVEQLVQLPVLGDLVQLDVVLLEAVERKLRLVVNEDLEGLDKRRMRISVTLIREHMERTTHVSHELLARHPDLLRERGAEHHDLLVVGGRPENLLNITTHV